MKVLITTDWYKPAINGVVTSVCNLRQELQQRGHEVAIRAAFSNRWTRCNSSWRSSFWEAFLHCTVQSGAYDTVPDDFPSGIGKQCQAVERHEYL
mgnify:CR=1 FL=1